MNDAAFAVPDIFSVDGHSVGRIQWLHAWCEIDVVGDQQGLPRFQADDKPLVPAVDGVVGKIRDDGAAKYCLKARASRRSLTLSLLDVAAGGWTSSGSE